MKIIIHDSNERNGSGKISNQIDKMMGKKETGQRRSVGSSGRLIGDKEISLGLRGVTRELLEVVKKCGS